MPKYVKLKYNNMSDLPTMITKDGTGLCSCLSVRLHDAVEFYKQNGQYPLNIDSSMQYWLYRDYKDHRIDKVLMDDYRRVENMPFINFNHGWQYSFYDEVQLPELSKLALIVCPISNRVGDKSYNFINILQNRTAVLYRGNDKVKELPATPYESMFEMALASESKSFLVQTDEAEFYEAFKSRYPDTIRYEELGMINRNADAYYLPKENKEGFAVSFIAALRALGHANKIITTTGNTSLWMMFFRGHTRNVWQYNSIYKRWKKLN